MNLLIYTAYLNVCIGINVLIHIYCLSVHEEWTRHVHIPFQTVWLLSIIQSEMMFIRMRKRSKCSLLQCRYRNEKKICLASKFFNRDDTLLLCCFNLGIFLHIQILTPIQTNQVLPWTLPLHACINYQVAASIVSCNSGQNQRWLNPDLIQMCQCSL